MLWKSQSALLQEEGFAATIAGPALQFLTFQNGRCSTIMQFCLTDCVDGLLVLTRVDIRKLLASGGEGCGHRCSCVCCTNPNGPDLYLYYEEHCAVHKTPVQVRFEQLSSSTALKGHQICSLFCQQLLRMPEGHMLRTAAHCSPGLLRKTVSL